MLIEKLVVDFLFLLTELFCKVLRLRRYTSENILKIGILQAMGQYSQNFHVEGDVPINHFRTDR